MNLSWSLVMIYIERERERERGGAKRVRGERKR